MFSLDLFFNFTFSLDLDYILDLNYNYNFSLFLFFRKFVAYSRTDFFTFVINYLSSYFAYYTFYVANFCHKLCDGFLTHGYATKTIIAKKTFAIF